MYTSTLLLCYMLFQFDLFFASYVSIIYISSVYRMVQKTFRVKKIILGHILQVDGQFGGIFYDHFMTKLQPSLFWKYTENQTAFGKVMGMSSFTLFIDCVQWPEFGTILYLLINRDCWCFHANIMLIYFTVIFSVSCLS